MAAANAQQPQLAAEPPVPNSPALIARRRLRQQRRRHLESQRVLAARTRDEPEDKPNITGGLNNIQMANLPVAAVPIEELPEPCAICLKGLERGEMHLRLPCTHAFHVTCVRPWLNTSVRCPHCRYNIAKYLKLSRMGVKYIHILAK